MTTVRYPTPPWCSFDVMMHFIDQLRLDGMPERIDESLFPRGYRQIAASVIAALKIMHLVDANGKPTFDLMTLVEGHEADRRRCMHDALYRAFPTIAKTDLCDRDTNGSYLRHHIADSYDVRRNLHVKAATFYEHASRYIGGPP